MAFGIAEGVVGLAGPPGVGKSTLLATFATLRRPHAGALKILGYETGNSSDLRALRARIGYLPGNFAWADNLTVGEFVAYAAYYKRVRSSATRSVLKRLELEESESTEMALVPPDVRLRAGLAATCVHEPELVLLDDPLRDLDAAEASEIMPLVRAMAPTVLVSAVEPRTLNGWCDRVFTLARGKLTESAAEPVREPVRGGAPRGRRPDVDRAGGDAARDSGREVREGRGGREVRSRSPLSRFGPEPRGEGKMPWRLREHCSSGV
ncbi:ATP-binding cassette domain-containing protein [Spirillospora sp. NPDC047279]|uniref:ATP-binding cassette domain-containing protein n=1 Tax=Spirillospora sp. NPDC047279 TaxID=3155478 RepID=UPI0033D0835C